MTVKIYFKSGNSEQIFDFEQVLYHEPGGQNICTKNDLDKFMLYDDSTYVFKAKSTLVVKGSDIKYVTFN